MTISEHFDFAEYSHDLKTHLSKGEISTFIFVHENI